MRLDREEFCAEAFDRFLVENFGARDMLWTHVPRGQDPPDFYLTMGLDRYAVEVTSTEVMRDVAVGAGQIREGTYMDSHRALVGELECLARESHVLSGRYIVRFRCPLSSPPTQFSRIKGVVFKHLLDFIASTQAVSSTPQEAVFYKKKAVCWVHKLDNCSDRVLPVFQHAGWPESPEFLDDVTRILHHALSWKRCKIEKGEVDLPVILLLLNTHLLAEVASYQQCIDRVAEREFFHSVFLVMDDGSVHCLHSRCVEWCPAI